jgi:hypothetical protein
MEYSKVNAKKKVIAMNTFIKKAERSQINSLMIKLEK